ncbi:MAG: hypothetical protein ACUVV3_06480 [Dehalococcoidia bacterium]
MIFNPFRLVLAAIGTILGLVVLLVVLTLVAAFAGSPGECDSGDREVRVSPAAAQELQAKLGRFDEQLDAGQPASFTFDESEATSRGRQFLDEKDAPIKDLKVCFNPGEASASGKVSAVLGLDLNVKVSGKVNLDGEHPRVDDIDLEIGKVPGFIPGGLQGLIEGVINDQLDHIDVEHRLSITFGEGTATLSGQP